MSLNLIAHCGAQHVNREALTGVVLPAATKSHVPVGHDYYVDLIEDQSNAVGLRVKDSAFALTNDGANMFGMFEIGTHKGADYATVIGFRNSHTKDFGAELACGSGVFVCDNLCFSGEVKVGTRHTMNIMDRLADLVTDAIGKVVHIKDVQDARYDSYKQAQLDKFQAEYLIIEMLRRGVVKTQRIEKVVKEWDHPKHKEFTKYGDSAWRMMNATTEALKGTNVARMPQTTRKLTELLDEVTEFAAAA